VGVTRPGAVPGAGHRPAFACLRWRKLWSEPVVVRGSVFTQASGEGEERKQDARKYGEGTSPCAGGWFGQLANLGGASHAIRPDRRKCCLTSAVAPVVGLIFLVLGKTP